LAVYQRLQEKHIDKICGFWVRKLIAQHDELWVIEMEFVVPPFVVDFATAGVDSSPLAKYSQEEMEAWFEERKELFEDKWPQAKQIIHGFRQHGIYLVDVKPGNITLNQATSRSRIEAPKIKHEHVQKAVNLIFPAEQRGAATQALSGNAFGDRTRLAIIALSNGSLPELCRLCESAAEDSRHVLTWAEFPEASLKSEMAERYRRMGAPVPPSLS
jgi:hypothetical protein